MDIISKAYSGSGNWITANESKPDVENNTLVIYDAEWRTNGGRAIIDSRVVYNSDYLASVWITYYYSGKYSGGSQYYWHFRFVGSEWQRATWKKLDDGERMLILDNIENLPKFAKMPGKLTRDYLKPKELQRLEIDEQGTIYGYKYLRVDNGKYYSPVYPVCWTDGLLESDKEPTENNTSGIYAMKSRKSPVLQKYTAYDTVLVRLALSGTVVEANEGLRAQRALIVGVL